MNADTTITTEKHGDIILIGLNRPKKMNAFNLDMLHGLSAAYTTYEQDAELRCAVVFAHGDHFTAGLDLAEVGPAVAEGQALFPEGDVDPMGLQPPRRTKPVICTVQGWCLTVGTELLLASDIRIAANNAQFGQIEVKRGIMPFGGATIRLPQVAGWGNAMRYLLTGDEFDAQQALHIGVVQEVVEPGRQFERALELAEMVAHCAPLAVQASLKSARLAVEQGNDAAQAVLLDEARSLMASEDALEGMMSFVERREARFKGR